MIPSDTRYKILIFTGDVEVETQRLRLDLFAREATSSSGFLTIYGRRTKLDKTTWGALFDVISVIAGKKEKVDYTSVPSALRAHWSK